jgi:hypothetical protein
MKHFVGMKKEEGKVATMVDFNRWFSDAQTDDLRKVWPHTSCRLLLIIPQDWKAMEKANHAEVRV